MPQRRTVSASIALAGFLITAGAWPVSSQSTGSDVIREWNAIMVATVAGQNPFAQGRFAAITQLAVFDAVNAIEGRYTPYLPGTMAPPGASPAAAAIAAAHTVLVTYFPAAAPGLDAARAASLASLPDGEAKASGIMAGEAAAAAIVAHRASDGSAPPQFHLPPSAEPGQWQLTPSCPASGGVLNHWQFVTPFGIESASQFRSAPPPTLDSRAYARDLNEVAEVGAVDSVARPQHKTDVARFYSAVLAVATWNPAVSQASRARRLSLAEQTRMFALLNMAISDGLVAVMDSKYEYALWRPETAIHHADADGNPRTQAQPGFQPLVAAPCFPSYGSAHAAASYAARRVAEKFLGDDDQAIVLSHPAVPGVVLEYSSFEEITRDIDDARVYGGIHFRFDQRAGARMGRAIGRWVVHHHLRRVAAGGVD